MAKKQPAKSAVKTTKKATATAKKAVKQAEVNVQEEEIVLSAAAKKALRLIEKSSKVCVELEAAVTVAVDKVVRKCMKDNGIELTADEANLLASILFGECDECE